MSIKLEIPTASVENMTATTLTVNGTFTTNGFIINPSGATTGQFLKYNGTSFVAATASPTTIGSTIGGTSKSILYVDGSGNLAQDNSNFAWDFTNHRLGIGINTPSFPLHVIGDGYYTSRLIVNGSSAAVSSSGAGAIRYNSSTNHLEFSENGGSYTAFGSGGGSTSIGGTVTGGTSKSVLYVDGSSNLAQDNSNFAWDASTHSLGLGTSSPLYTIDIRNATDVSSFHLRTGSASSDDGFYINAGASGGATISVGAKNTGGGTWQARSATAGFIDIQSYGLGYYFNAGLTVGNNFTPSRKLLIDTSGNVLIGDSTATNGKLQIETQDSNFGQIQIANTVSNSEASIAYISGATAIGTSPTSTNGTDHIWALGAGAGGVGGNKFTLYNAGAGSPVATFDGTNYRFGVGKGNTSPATTLDVGDPSVTTNSIALRAGSTAGVSSSNTGRLRYNESTQHFEISENGGSYSQVGAGGSMAIGSSVSGGSTSSILFVDGSGNLAQNNTAFKWVDSSKELQITQSAADPADGTGAITLKNTLSSSIAQIAFQNHSSTFKTSIGYSNSGGNMYWFMPSGVDWHIATNGSDTHNFKGDGTFGVGTLSPANRLSVNGAASFGTYATTAAPSNGVIISGTTSIGTTDGTTLGEHKLIVARDNTWPSDTISSQLALVGATTPAIKTVFGTDTSGNSGNGYGFIASGHEGVQWNFLALQPAGGFIAIGNTAPSTFLDIADFSGGNTAAIALRAGQSAGTSASNTGRVRYNASTQLFQISNNTAAYADIISGALTATRIPFASAAGTLTDDSNLVWDNTNKRLGIGASPGIYALNVHSSLTADVNVAIENTNSSGYSGISWRDSSDTQKGSMGYGNASVGLTYAQGTLFSYSDATGNAPWIWMTGTSRLMSLYASTAGNLNIGTSTSDPGIKLNIEASSTSAGIALGNGGSLAASSTNTGRIRYNTSVQHFEISENGGSYSQISSGSGMSIGGAISGSTSGSVLYVNSSNQLAQNNSNLFWDNSNTRLGVGTASPDRVVDIRASGANPVLSIQHNDSSSFSAIDFFDNSRAFKSAFGYANASVADTTTAGKMYWYAENGIDRVIARYSGVTNTIAMMYFKNSNGYIGIGSNSSPVAQLDQTQTVATTGSPIGRQYTGAAHTTLTASTEAMDGYYKLDRTVQFATGALTTQRAMYISAPTYAFAGASTLTNAATLAIGNAPQTGTNATITNAYALWVQAGTARFDGGIKFNDGTSQTTAPTVAEKANASSTQVTTTSATDIVSFTPTSQGNFQVNVYYRVVTATSNITMVVTWTDDTGAQTQTLVATATSTVVGSYVLQPIYINATTGSAIKVTATTGTANNLYVSASIIGIT